MSKYLIYGLKDPATDLIRYVGMSTSGLKRPRMHLKESAYNHPLRRGYHVYGWIRSLLAKNLTPVIEVLEFTDKDNVYVREQELIKKYREMGCDLCNHTDGGPGMLGFKPTQETIDKIRATKSTRVYNISDETRLKLSERFRGEKHPSWGKKASPEHRKKLSDAHKGQKPSEEQKLKISAALKGIKRGPIADERKKILRQAASKRAVPVIEVTTGREFPSIKEASRYFNVGSISISKMCRGEKRYFQEGYIFKFKDKETILLSPEPPRLRHAIYCKELDREFPSVLNASKELGLNFSTLRDIVSGSRKFKKDINGYTFTYINKDVA